MPWTLAVPKPILPVANEPALGHLLRLTARCGYRNIIANASWLGELMQDVIGDGTAYGVDLSWSIEKEPLGTAGGVLAAQDKLRDGDEPIIVLSGDGLHDIDIAAVERTHRSSGALATLALLPVSDASQYGVAVLDKDGFITGFQEKPKSGAELSKLANTGIYVFSPQVLDLCSEWNMTDFGSELLPRLVSEKRSVKAHVIENHYWNDIGNLDEWRLTNAAAVTGQIDLGLQLDDEPSLWGEGVLVHPSADIDPSVTFDGFCVIGAGACVSSGVYLRDALVLPGAEIVKNQIIASGTVGSLEGLKSWAESFVA